MLELAGYEIIRSLGEGAMGPVYLARQLSPNRHVVIKRIVGVWNDNRTLVARYPAEAEALERMSHPNVIGICDLRTAGSDLFFISEYALGPSLRHLIDGGLLTPPAVLHVLAGVAAALDYAGGQAIFHGDLKPANVFVESTGEARVGDFGLVSMLSGRDRGDGTPGPILGTPAYMSPEHASGRPDVGPGSDIYSLAVMAYELLVGRLPFPSVPGDANATLDAHIGAPIPRPTSSDPGFPASIEGVLLRGLAKSPADRPATAGRFVGELSAAAESAWPGLAAGDGDIAAIAAAAAPPPPAPLASPGEAALFPTIAADPFEEPEGEESTPRRPLPVAWIGVLVLLIALGGGALLVANMQVFGSATPLRITAVSATVNQPIGHCPAAAFVFTAKVDTNGQGGAVTYKWTKPSGGDSETVTGTLGSGTRETSTNFTFQFQGQGATEGDAVFQILSPNEIKAAPVHVSYKCP